jgi:hypothetical protein
VPQDKQDIGSQAVINYCSVFLLAIACCLLVWGLAKAENKSPLDRFSREQREKLLAGKVVYEYINYEGREKEEKGLGHGQAYVIVNKPVDVCWSIMTDFDRKKEYYPRVVVSDVVKREENRAWVREVLDFGIANIEYVMVQNMDPENRRVNFSLDPAYKHDLKDTHGFWYWEKINDTSSLLSYAVTKADVGIPAPEFIVKALSSQDLPGIAENLKKRIESDGKWRKTE